MSLPEESQKPLSRVQKLLDLESDLPLTPADLRAMQLSRGVHDLDFARYIEWIEEIGAFKTRKADPKIYPERFEL